MVQTNQDINLNINRVAICEYSRLGINSNFIKLIGITAKKIKNI